MDDLNLFKIIIKVSVFVSKCVARASTTPKINFVHNLKVKNQAYYLHTPPAILRYAIIPEWYIHLHWHLQNEYKKHLKST